MEAIENFKLKNFAAIYLHTVIWSKPQSNLSVNSDSNFLLVFFCAS
uniref:Uncharacterized protein n=1 Tax=Arundo donax TaxID=35708 RepID=A0A0A8YG69_ARUDO